MPITKDRDQMFPQICSSNFGEQAVRKGAHTEEVNIKAKAVKLPSRLPHIKPQFCELAQVFVLEILE